MIQENLLSLIQQLANQPITPSTEKEIKQLLVMVKNKCRSTALAEEGSSLPKTKKIRKFFSKRSYKKYLKNRIPLIVQKSLNRVISRLPKPAIITQNTNKKSQGGKSKFKISTQRRKNAKQLNFMNKIKAGLRISNHQELSCPICLQTMVSPALTICGHVFCLECIDESLLFAHTCPTCRQNIRFSEPITCRVLDDLIRTKIFMTESQVLQFQARLSKFERWRQMRFLDYNYLRAGTLVDVRDTENIWCQGDILRIYRKRSKTTGKTTTVALLIHYQRWNKLYNEIIDIPSSRLAPLNCFSGRIDIPRYNLSEPDGNLRGSVVSGTALRIQFANPNPLPINFHFDLLNESDQILEIDESEQESSNQGEQNQASQNQEQEQQQQNSEAINEPDEAASPFFQHFWNNFRNRLIHGRFNEDILPRRNPEPRHVQIYFDQAIDQSRLPVDEPEQRHPQNYDNFQRVSDQDIQNIEQAVDSRQQSDLVPLRETQQVLSKNQSERKQNEGQEYQAGHDCQ